MAPSAPRRATLCVGALSAVVVPVRSNRTPPIPGAVTAPPHEARSMYRDEGTVTCTEIVDNPYFRFPATVVAHGGQVCNGPFTGQGFEIDLQYSRKHGGWGIHWHSWDSIRHLQWRPQRLAWYDGSFASGEWHDGGNYRALIRGYFIGPSGRTTGRWTESDHRIIRCTGH